MLHSLNTCHSILELSLRVSKLSTDYRVSPVRSPNTFRERGLRLPDIPWMPQLLYEGNHEGCGTFRWAFPKFKQNFLHPSTLLEDTINNNNNNNFEVLSTNIVPRLVTHHSAHASKLRFEVSIVLRGIDNSEPTADHHALASSHQSKHLHIFPLHSPAREQCLSNSNIMISLQIKKISRPLLPHPSQLRAQWNKRGWQSLPA